MTRRGVSDLARYIHPEFGGFCLTARLRCDIRVVAVSVLLGTMVGGVGAAIVGMSSRSPAGSSAATAVAVSEAAIKAAESSSSQGDASDTAKAGSVSGGGLASASAAEVSPAPKAKCPSSGVTSGNEQGCSFFKTRRVRVRALNDAPEMARIAVGRPAAPSVAPPQNSAQNSPAKPAVSETIDEKTRSAVAHAQPSAKARRPAATKVQKITRRSRGNDRWIDPAPRDLVDPWSARAENNSGAARRPYAREASSARKGFWDWSW
jgi:hypothetical protein